MAANVQDRPQFERRHHERRHNWNPTATMGGHVMRVSWGGIWGGVLVAFGLLMLLTALGVAVGITAVDPSETSAGAIGTGTGIWGALSLLVALFVGGMAATRISAITDRTTSFFEGALVWVVSMLLVVYFASSGVGMLASGAFSMIGGATQALGAVAQQSGANVDTSGTVEQIAARLRDPQTAQQIANVTGLQATEVQSTLEQTASRVEASRDDPAQAAEEAQRGVADLMQRAQQSGALARQAEEVQPEVTAGAWITFFALVLSLAAAIFGAMRGRRKPGDVPLRSTVA
jgi:hypothetical protein